MHQARIAKDRLRGHLAKVLSAEASRLITGFGIGLREGSKVLKIYTRHKHPLLDLLAKKLIPEDFEGHKVEIEERVFKARKIPIISDIIERASGEKSEKKPRREKSGYASKVRPLTPGYSVGLLADGAGTIGGIFERRLKGKKIKIILSNNHVLAGGNLAKIGSTAVQPGSIDSENESSNFSEDIVGSLVDFEPITIIENYRDLFLKKGTEIDGAIATVFPQVPTTEEFPIFGKIKGIVESTLGMEIEKVGRTTGHTKGTVTALDTDLQVEYQSGIGMLSGVIVSDLPSGPGDSGSLIVTKGLDGYYATGLLFAGSEDPNTGESLDTVYCDIGKVLERFKISF